MTVSPIAARRRSIEIFNTAGSSILNAICLPENVTRASEGSVPSKRVYSLTLRYSIGTTNVRSTVPGW
jgi:hypothetical protein